MSIDKSYDNDLAMAKAAAPCPPMAQPIDDEGAKAALAAWFANTNQGWAVAMDAAIRAYLAATTSATIKGREERVAELEAAIDAEEKPHGAPWRYWSDKAREAAQRAELAEARLREAEEVLRPFAEAAENLEDDHRDNSPIWEAPAAMGIDAKHLRAARATLKGSTHE